MNEKPDPVFSPAIAWINPLAPVGPENDPLLKLLGRLAIAGAEFQAEAFEVEDIQEGDDTVQVGKQDEDETYLSETLEIVQGAAETITIKGRDYVLLITPCQR